jgi:preprotein translocase subunit SecA
MQEIRETRGQETIVSRLVGIESERLRKEFSERREALEARLESGETQQATVTEHRRIGRNDPCPCGSKEKFKKCCGKRLAHSDERIAQ